MEVGEVWIGICGILLDWCIGFCYMNLFLLCVCVLGGIGWLGFMCSEMRYWGSVGTLRFNESV